MVSHYSFGRISDADVLSLMDGLIGAYKASEATVSIGDTKLVVQRSEEEGITDDGRDNLSPILRKDTYFINHMVWKTANLSVEYFRSKRRGLGVNGTEGWIHSDTPYIDGISVKSTSNHTAYLLGIVSRHVAMAPPIVGGAEAGSALDQSQAILNRVSTAVSAMIEHTADRQKDLDKTRLELADEAEQVLSAARAEVMAQKDKIESEYFEKKEFLRKKELELDDRENTHVRREFAKQMASLSDTRLSSNLLSKSNLSFLIPILISLISVMILVYFIFIEISQINKFTQSVAEIIKDKFISSEDKPKLIDNISYNLMYTQIRIAFQSIGVAALVWFSLRLSSSRHSSVSSWERELHKFRLDTERAGFLVEGDLEARKVNEHGLPEILLESFSRNLFAGSDKSHSDAGEDGLGSALTALLGQAAKVRLGPDGVNVEVEGRGIRRAKKAIDEG